MVFFAQTISIIRFKNVIIPRAFICTCMCIFVCMYLYVHGKGNGEQFIFKHFICVIIKMRLKKHRWHGRILKTRDPIILSLGWRRFQTMPLYHVEDHNGRHRLLKYTPQNMHCGATIWGETHTHYFNVYCHQSEGGGVASKYMKYKPYS